MDYFHAVVCVRLTVGLGAASSGLPPGGESSLNLFSTDDLAAAPGRHLAPLAHEPQPESSSRSRHRDGGAPGDRGHDGPRGAGGGSGGGGGARGTARTAPARLEPLPKPGAQSRRAAGGEPRGAEPRRAEPRGVERRGGGDRQRVVRYADELSESGREGYHQGFGQQGHDHQGYDRGGYDHERRGQDRRGEGEVFGRRAEHGSSNAFASGASQNTGNVLTNRWVCG